MDTNEESLKIISLCTGMDIKEKNRIRQKKWRDKNPDKSKENCRKYYEKNRNIILEQKKLKFQTFKNNGYSDKRREYQRVNCRYRRIANKCFNPLTIKEWLDILKESNHSCKICGEIDDLTMDHIIPITKGGLHTKCNIQVLCRKCSSSKGTKI